MPHIQRAAWRFFLRGKRSALASSVLTTSLRYPTALKATTLPSPPSSILFSTTPIPAKKPSAAALPPRPTLPSSEITHSYLKGSGPGGQKINKTNSAAQLTHLPTGIVVKSQATRSRSQNYTIARRILAEKVELLEKGAESRVMLKRERERKKKASGAKKRRRKYRALEREKEGEEGEWEGDGEEELGGGEARLEMEGQVLDGKSIGSGEGNENGAEHAKASRMAHDGGMHNGHAPKPA